MSGECDKCGEHCLECWCEDLMNAPMGKIRQKSTFMKVLKFVFHPCLVVIPACYIFEPMQVTMIGVMLISTELYFHR